MGSCPSRRSTWIAIRPTQASLTYDATLVALAVILDCELVTADRRLADAPGPRWVIRVLS
jgi:predicted nucleic acid-binding protein